MSKKQHWQRAISRRRALALVGVGGAGTIAGCLGGDGGNGNGNGNGNDSGNGNGNDSGNGNGDDSGNGEDALEEYYGGEAEDVEQDFDADYEQWSEAVPSGGSTPYDGEYIFNPYHSSWNAGDFQELSYEYLSVYHTGQGEYIPRIADDWETNEDNLETEITLSSDYGWSNGDPITAADFETAMRLDGYMELGIETYIDPNEGITAEDDTTLVLQPREDYQDLEISFWENQFAEWLLNLSDAHYGGFVEEFADTDSDDEISNIQSNVVDFAPEWNQAMYSGPFMWIEANEEYADRVPNQNHPVAQDWEFYVRLGQAAEEEGLRAEELTWAHNTAMTVDDLPDIYESPPVSYSGQTFALLFGPQDQYIVEEPDVRKAIAYAIDCQSLVDTVAPSTPVDTYSAGVDIGYIENYIAEDALEAMTDYSVHDPDRAQELLEGVGFSRDDGTWYTPEDEEWQLEFPHGDWFPDQGEIINNNLTEFGITSERYSDAMGTWQSEYGDTLEYDISVQLNYGMARQYHPLPDFEEELFNADRAAVTGTEILNEEVEVPEVGNPEGDTITVNFQEALDNMAVADGEDELMEIATEVAWAHNQLLPNLMIYPWSEHYWVDAANWDFDVESDDWLTSNRIAHYLLQNGLSQA